LKGEGIAVSPSVDAKDIGDRATLVFLMEEWCANDAVNTCGIWREFPPAAHPMWEALPNEACNWLASPLRRGIVVAVLKLDKLDRSKSLQLPVADNNSAIPSMAAAISPRAAKQLVDGYPTKDCNITLRTFQKTATITSEGV
jgi:hypothetical protein